MDGADGRPSAERRAAFRAFVREHHPDRGGDPATFAAGVDEFRAGPARDPRRAADATASGAGPGPDAGTGSATGGHPAPSGRMSLPVRVGVALIRTWHRRHERGEPR